MSDYYVKKRQNPYTQIPNALIDDHEIKPAVRFVYVLLYSKPNDWKFYRKNLAKTLSINNETLDKYLSILEERGWIKRNQQKNEKGQFGCLEIEMMENILTDTEKNRYGKNRERENRARKNPQHSNTNLTNTNYTNTNSNSEFEKNSQSDPEFFEEIHLIEEVEEKKKVAQKKKSPSLFDEVKVWPTFDHFWELYDKKTGREKAEKKWQKLNQREKEKIMEVIPDYKLSQPDKQYRKNPETYLNGKHWEDELIFKGKKMDAVDQLLAENGLTLNDLDKFRL